MKHRVKEEDKLARGARWMEKEACRLQRAIKKLKIRWNRVFIARQNVRLDSSSSSKEKKEKEKKEKKEKDEVPPLSDDFNFSLEQSMTMTKQLLALMEKTLEVEAEETDPMEALMDADTDVVEESSDEEEGKKEEEKEGEGSSTTVTEEEEAPAYQTY